MPLSEAARRLERLFGIEIRVADEALARRRFTGSIRGANLHAELRSLAQLLDARYERRGSAVVLSSLPAGATAR